MHQLVPDLFVIPVNNPKKPLYAINSFRNKIFWKGIIKSPLKSFGRTQSLLSKTKVALN